MQRIRRTSQHCAYVALFRQRLNPVTRRSSACAARNQAAGNLHGDELHDRHRWKARLAYELKAYAIIRFERPRHPSTPAMALMIASAIRRCWSRGRSRCCRQSAGTRCRRERLLERDCLASPHRAGGQVRNQSVAPRWRGRSHTQSAMVASGESAIRDRAVAVAAETPAHARTPMADIHHLPPPSG
jgi:hypothetical protein